MIPDCQFHLLEKQGTHMKNKPKPRTQVILVQLDFLHESRHDEGEGLPVEVVKRVAHEHGQEYACPVVPIAVPGHGCTCRPSKSLLKAWLLQPDLRVSATFASAPGGGDSGSGSAATRGRFQQLSIIDHVLGLFFLTKTMKMSSWSLRSCFFFFFCGGHCVSVC